MLSTPAAAMDTKFANKLAMQHRLFAELSSMFSAEVPLYDKSLLVNRVCNKTVCALLGKLHEGFEISDEQLERTSGERHGAIRIGTPEEYRWIAGFFAAFDMEPHNFYDMTSLGGKSQPIIATAFRSPLNPEHRVFSSLLMIDYFDAETGKRIADLLGRRQVFSDRAKELVLKNEEDGGLTEEDAEELIREGTTRIFKWTGHANDFALYTDLCNAGFKIAADIACFQSHHLNHLTPNTFCIDLYTTAMKFCLGELDVATFEARAAQALAQLAGMADRDYMKLHFRHLSLADLARFEAGSVTKAEITSLASSLSSRLSQSDLELTKLPHSGFKDFTEGPSADTPILLRQDAYKALTEAVKFHEQDGTVVDKVHTARFGEIEQRFYATTPTGRALYDECLLKAEAERERDPAAAKNNHAAYAAHYAAAFAPFPKTLPELLKAGHVYARYSATAKGAASSQQITTTDIHSLVEQGFVDYEGLRYEDFLPFSAAGIFASNLGQYGTKSSAQERPTYLKETLEGIMGRTIIDPNVVYKGLQAESLIETYTELGILDKVTAGERAELEAAVAAYRSRLG